MCVIHACVTRCDTLRCLCVYNVVGGVFYRVVHKDRSVLTPLKAPTLEKGGGGDRGRIITALRSNLCTLVN